MRVWSVESAGSFDRDMEVKYTFASSYSFMTTSQLTTDFLFQRCECGSKDSGTTKLVKTWVKGKQAFSPSSLLSVISSLEMRMEVLHFQGHLQHMDQHHRGLSQNLWASWVMLIRKTQVSWLRNFVHLLLYCNLMRQSMLRSRRAVIYASSLQKEYWSLIRRECK